jgi:hypothetical protein
MVARSECVVALQLLAVLLKIKHAIFLISLSLIFSVSFLTKSISSLTGNKYHLSKKVFPDFW